MNEFELAQDLIETYKAMKEQNPKTIATGANIQRPEYKNCDFELLRKFLYNKHFNMKFEVIDGWKNVIISPLP